MDRGFATTHPGVEFFVRVLRDHAAHTDLVQRHVSRVWRFSIRSSRDCLARYRNGVLGLPYLGDVTATPVGVVGRCDFVGLVHILYDTHPPQIKLLGYSVGAGIPAAGNGIPGGTAVPGLSFCCPGRNTASHNLGGGSFIETALPARRLGPEPRNKGK